MKHIRAWIVRLLQGEAKSAPPGDGLMRMDYDAMRDAMTQDPVPLNEGVDISAYITEADVTTYELEQELAMKLTAGELNHNHIGKIVTVTRDQTAVTGILTSIKHIADLIDDRRQFDVLPRLVLGQATTTVDIMHAGRIQLDSNSKVTVGA